MLPFLRKLRGSGASGKNSSLLVVCTVGAKNPPLLLKLELCSLCKNYSLLLELELEVMVGKKPIDFLANLTSVS